jgi:hypothetical protein
MSTVHSERIRPLRVFCSYAHEDERFRRELRMHLGQLERQQIIVAWDDREIAAGEDWDGEIKKELNQADVVLFLVSEAFEASDYCWNEEVKRAFERISEGVRVLPIYVKRVSLKLTRFKGPKALPLHPTAGIKPVEEWSPRRNRAYVQVVERILEIATEAADEGSPDKADECIWAVPEDRARIPLVGRDELVQQLTAEFESGPVIALVGGGGVGKTSVAVEYAWQQRDSARLVAWLDSENETKLALRYALLAGEVGLAATTQEVARSAFRSWLADHDRWLLVFDNPVSVKAVRRLLPDDIRGRVLITSRAPGWSGFARELPVDVLSEDDASWYLLNGTKSTDLDAARELATRLRMVPLALSNAVATIREKRLSFADYIDEYVVRLEDEDS